MRVNSTMESRMGMEDFRTHRSSMKATSKMDNYMEKGKSVMLQVRFSKVFSKMRRK